jgi:hypothetical protein
MLRISFLKDNEAMPVVTTQAVGGADPDEIMVVLGNGVDNI